MERKIVIALIFITCSNLVKAQLQTTVQRGHSLAVRTVCFSPNGEYIASGSEDKTIKIWEVRTGREVKTLLGHQSQVNEVIFSSDGRQIISGGRDRNIFIWDLQSEKILKKYHYPDESIVSLDLSRDDRYLAIGTTKRLVRILDLKSDSIVFEHKANVGQYGSQVVFSEDDRLLAVGEDNRTVKVYDWLSKELVADIGESYGSCGGCDTRLVFLDENTIIKASRGSPVASQVFSAEDPRQVFIAESEERIEALRLNRENSSFIIVDEDSATAFDLNSGKQLFTLDHLEKPRDPKYGLDLLNKVPERNTDQFNDANFSPDGQLIVTGDNSNLVTLWNAKSGQKESVFYGYLSIPSDDGLNFDPNSYWSSYAWGLVALKNQVELSPDGKYAYRAKVGFEARKWELATGNIVQTYFGHEQGVICFKLSKDGRRLLTGSADNTVRLWNTETGETLKVFSGHRGFIYSVAFSHDESMVVSSGADGYVMLWNTTSGELIKSKRLSDDRQKVEIGYEVQFSPNDLYLIVSYTHGAIKMIEIDTGREFRELIGHTAVSPSVAMLSNGRQMISTGWDMTLRLWDLATGMQERKYVGHNDPVQALDINKSGTRLISGGTDRVIIMWDLATGKEIKRFEGHKSIITSVKFTPDEKRIVSSTIDGITKVWDIETGLEVITHFSIGSKDWLVTTTSGYFNGTGDAQKQVFFTKGFETYSLDRFFNRYYNPEAIKKAFEAPAIQDKRQGLLERLEQNPPPGVEITSPRPGEETSKNSLEVLARIKNEGGGLKAVSLILNGKVIEKKEESYYDKLAKDKSIIQKFNLNLVPGLNTINVSATNSENIESQASQVIVNFNSSEEQSVCYVMAIGINEYQNPALNLNYANDDATAFVELIKEVGAGLYDKVEVHQIFNKDATKTNILGILDILAQKIGPNDVFYLYYAGHGSMVDDEFYFIPTENTRLYSSEKLSKDGISATYLQQKLRNIKALKQMVLIDACQSGGSVELLAQRGAREEKAMAQLSRSAGIHVLSAAGSEQFATEYAEIGHGVFTYALLEALKGEADGAPEDGTVSIYELKSYIENMVPEYSQKFKGQVQYPYTFSKGQDFPVGIFKKK
jgi:WD40 repeat protein